MRKVLTCRPKAQYGAGRADVQRRRDVQEPRRRRGENYQLVLNKQSARSATWPCPARRLPKCEAQVAQARLRSKTRKKICATHDRQPARRLVLSRDVNVGDAVSSILVLGSQATLIMTLGDVSEFTAGRWMKRHRQGVSQSAARIVVESFKDKKSPARSPRFPR